SAGGTQSPDSAPGGLRRVRGARQRVLNSSRVNLRPPLRILLRRILSGAVLAQSGSATNATQSSSGVSEAQQPPRHPPRRLPELFRPFDPHLALQPEQLLDHPVQA